MKFTFYHNNINVADLDKSIEFLQEMHLDLRLQKRQKLPTEASSWYSWVMIPPAQLELTWLRDMDRPYDLGDNEIHLAMQTDDMDAALAFHKEMNCVCFENPEMGIYFINDPDGYWVEICPEV
mgnify:CR=1 FL=1